MAYGIVEQSGSSTSGPGGRGMLLVPRHLLGVGAADPGPGLRPGPLRARDGGAWRGARVTWRVRGGWDSAEGEGKNYQRTRKKDGGGQAVEPGN